MSNKNTHKKKTYLIHAETVRLKNHHKKTETHWLRVDRACRRRDTGHCASRAGLVCSVPTCYETAPLAIERLPLWSHVLLIFESSFEDIFDVYATSLQCTWQLRFFRDFSAFCIWNWLLRVQGWLNFLMIKWDGIKALIFDRRFQWIKFIELEWISSSKILAFFFISH